MSLGCNATANREIKDGIFKLLFEKPANAAELYYALTGIECQPDEIQIITLSTIVSGRLKNDLAFVVKGRAMVIGEHQSTPNENMPLRMLMYLGQLCDKWIKMKGEERFLYRTNLYKIPTPEFAVFYNGTEDRPEREILNLSKAFEYPQNKEFGYLELKVPVYNINKGMSQELTSKSNHLREYTEFIAKLREYQKIYEDFETAVKETVNYCIANGILAEFLRENGGRIMSVLATEYNQEAHVRVLLEEKYLEIAKTMLLKGYPVSSISEIVGLSESEILLLQKRLGIGR
jgi:predicted transposase/invertase (TIGR01784 family)